MNITVFTIFPNIIKNFCNESLLGIALKKNIWHLDIVNIREYANNKHSKVDDMPYGGGKGMIMRADVLGNAIENKINSNTKIYYMSPKGGKLNQTKINEISRMNNIAIICGRYEGIDERIIEEYNVEEISIGDFVIMGGELPALILIEGVVRCLEGVINKDSVIEDSFGGNTNNIYRNLLEYPQYTLPRIWKNREVPTVLLSGNHKKIKEWKLEKSIEITKNRRPDIYENFLEDNHNYSIIN